MESKLKAQAMDSVGERTEFTPSIINKRFADSFIPDNAKVTAVKIGDKVATCVEELPNLLLREGGYPHLPTTPIKQEPKSVAWNDASTNPTKCKVYETITGKGEVKAYQFWTGEYWGFASATAQQAIEYKHYKETTLKTTKWREV